MPLPQFTGVPLRDDSFAYRNLNGTDSWETTWTPVFTSLTVIGSPTYIGRFMLVGNHICAFQVTLVSTTSVASAAGTTYVTLPITPTGISGIASMSNSTTNAVVGGCHIETNGRCYLPTQAATAATLRIAGFYEV